jgi:hypothetical protein
VRSNFFFDMVLFLQTITIKKSSGFSISHPGNLFPRKFILPVQPPPSVWSG